MSDKKEKMIVNGFVFANEAEAKQAEKEVEGVKFIKEKMEMDKPEVVLEIYNKMVRQNLFETAVGFSYLKDLQEYLQSIPFVNKEEILPIQVQHPILEEQMRGNRVASKPKQPEKVKERYVNIDYKNRYRIMRGIAVVLLVCVAAMFAISATVGSPTILNYEQELINRYAEWEQELNEREAWITEREAELGKKAE
ncbi:MAG: hypothetical protein PUJ55_16065 [Clostridiales bacterium]|nr:hypothetical protein [Roseburia sp.]MDD7638437.1 hypothetical protein [Clostridiales bacterium]MDY4113582.1 hypothetical protein [Roseburia sp.]